MMALTKKDPSEVVFVTFGSLYKFALGPVSPLIDSYVCYYKVIKILFSCLTGFFILFPFKHKMLHSILSKVSCPLQIFAQAKVPHLTCQLHRQVKHVLFKVLFTVRSNVHTIAWTDDERST